MQGNGHTHTYSHLFSPYSGISSHSFGCSKGHDKNNNQHEIPTLPKIAQKVAKLEKTQLDEKQYIAYEMIACTFFLGLVNDGCDKNAKLGAYLYQTMEITFTADGNDTIKKLKARGGRDQLLMFLTGPAGLGKSTAMKVAQQFCYEFCIAVGMIWSDKTYGPYTALNIEIFRFGIDCLILFVAMIAKVVIAAMFALQQIHSLF